MAEQMKKERARRLFLIAFVLFTFANGFGGSIISNYFKGVYQVDSVQRGLLEIPRELPGVVGVFVITALSGCGNLTLAMISFCLYAVLNVIPKHLDATISKLVDIGCEVEEFDDAVRVVAKNRLRSTQVKTLPYPGYPTDMQPQIGVVLALAQGTSTITESIFENRFKYLDELARMGAVIKVEGNSATIEGVEKFSGARVSAPDLRAGAALCIAGLATDGITIVDDIVYIQRGYERFEEKLRGLGGIIEKVSDEKEIQKFKLKVG